MAQRLSGDFAGAWHYRKTVADRPSRAAAQTKAAGFVSTTRETRDPVLLRLAIIRAKSDGKAIVDLHGLDAILEQSATMNSLSRSNMMGRPADGGGASITVVGGSAERSTSGTHVVGRVSALDTFQEERTRGGDSFFYNQQIEMLRGQAQRGDAPRVIVVRD